MRPEVAIPLAVGTCTLLGIASRLLWRFYRLVSRIDDAVPTLERIAHDFPKKTLKRDLSDIRRAIDLQSQVLRSTSEEVQRLGAIIDRRRAADTLPSAVDPRSWLPLEKGGRGEPPQRIGP